MAPGNGRVAGFTQRFNLIVLQSKLYRMLKDRSLTERPLGPSRSADACRLVEQALSLISPTEAGCLRHTFLGLSDPLIPGQIGQIW
jgi:hypothetical protein